MTLTPPAYPGPDTICEDCGYALKGLQPDGGCPECGLPIADSSPKLRTGPDWQASPGPRAAFSIVIALMLNPKSFFRGMRVDGSNTTARLFLLIVASAIGLLWYSLPWNLSKSTPMFHLFQAVIVCDSVILLSYIEAVGVVYFARRRDWRVPFRLSERLVCYCSIGWVPAAGVMWLAIYLVGNGYVDRWMNRLLPAWEYWQSLALLVLIAAVAMMWFEVLVWLGVRQTKHANA